MTRIRELPKTPQPPCCTPAQRLPQTAPRSHPSPSPLGQKLNPGDRVVGLGNLGNPTREFGTVAQANEDDAVVIWDGDGRIRLHQRSLKKV
jgi:hypothetical protein